MSIIRVLYPCIIPYTESDSSIFNYGLQDCSRREDGLSCRHGVKPPLTHSRLQDCDDSVLLPSSLSTPR